MQGDEMHPPRWQAVTVGGPRWPSMVVIDDGFFSSQDSGIRPWLFRGFPDGSGVPPIGTADGDSAHNPPDYGLHGTRVLSLLASGERRSGGRRSCCPTAPRKRSARRPAPGSTSTRRRRTSSSSCATDSS